MQSDAKRFYVALLNGVQRARSMAWILLALVVTLLSLPGELRAAGQLHGPHITPKFSAPPPNGAAGLCRKYAWACETNRVSQRPATDILKLAKSINSQINRTVRQIDDSRQYGVKEYWSLPTQLGGDCEDFALLKKAALIQEGVPAKNLLIATVLDTRQFNHAVLVVRTNDGDFVLDNLTDRVVLWSKTRYSFLKIQDPTAPHLWRAVLAGGAFK